MTKDTIKRFWVVTQKSDGKNFATVNVSDVELCLKHPGLVHVAEVTVTETITNKMYRKDLTAIDMTLIELSKADVF